MSHVTHTSCTYEWIMSHMNESRHAHTHTHIHTHTYAHAHAHTHAQLVLLLVADFALCICHVTHISCIYEGVMLHGTYKWISHVTHTHTRIHTHTHTHIFSHTKTHTRTHTHRHIRTHTHTPCPYFPTHTHALFLARVQWDPHPRLRFHEQL